MRRYFLEVAYKGTRYSGFQVQQNAPTIQSEIEKTFQIFFRQSISLTGSSRTDTGVHARQNYFHFDYDNEIDTSVLYNINSMLPEDIVIRSIIPMALKADGNQPHCRFDALSRTYQYIIYQKKDPFLNGTAYYFPYALNEKCLDETAAAILKNSDFTSFSKRNTQVKTFQCKIKKSEWEVRENLLIYTVEANRFLRGMVRALVGTMLQSAKGKISTQQFVEIMEKKDSTLADFSTPPHGLFLIRVTYPDNFFPG